MGFCFKFGYLYKLIILKVLKLRVHYIIIHLFMIEDFSR